MVEGRAVQLIGTGEFKQAAEWLESRKEVSQGDRVLRAHIELEIGDPALAKEQTESLLREHLNTRTRAYCLSLAGRATGRLGSPRQGIALQRKATSLAAHVDPGLEADLLASLVSSLLNWIGIEPAVSELGRLRRAALASANAQALIEYHLVSARIAAMRGWLRRAMMESQTAENLLARSENTTQLWKTRQLQSNVAIKACDLKAARGHALQCLRLAEQTGARLSVGTTLGNLAHIASLTGEFDQCRRFLNSAMAALDGQSHISAAAYSTGLELALSCGDDEFAADMVSRYDASRGSRGELSHYDLWFRLNRVRWLLNSDHPREAGDQAVESLASIQKLADADLFDRMSLLAAEAKMVSGASSEALAFFDQVKLAPKSRSLETIAETDRVAAVLDQGRRGGASEFYLARAYRVLSAAGLLGSLAFVENTAKRLGIPLATLASRRTATNGLEVLWSISGVLALTPYPRAMGGEIATLLSSLGVCEEVSVVAKDVDERSDMAATSGSPSSISLGREHGTTLRLCATPRVDSRFTEAWESISRVARSGEASFTLAAKEEEAVALWPVEEPHSQFGMVVAAENMTELLNTARRLAASTITVLITGETGTGKELLARALHDASPRRQKPFLPFNCTSVPRDMLDAQLFGFRRGAFTGAHDSFPGVIRGAAGGTLFLDEIGEISLDVQPKLLRFLESAEIHPLGEARPSTVDVRVVAATNANLDKLVADGRFREDLFYRLNVVRLEVPPLRERREEVPLLVQHYLDKYSREYHKTGLRPAEETMEYLIVYKWPGNVRQLANELRRLVALAEPGAVLMPEHLSPEIAASRRTIPPSERELAPTEFVVRTDQPLAAAVEHVERTLIQNALRQTSGVEEAAQLLGLSRKGLYLKRQRLGITH